MNNKLILGNGTRLNGDEDYVRIIVLEYNKVKGNDVKIYSLKEITQLGIDIDINNSLVLIDSEKMTVSNEDNEWLKNRFRKSSCFFLEESSNQYYITVLNDDIELMDKIRYILNCHRIGFTSSSFNPEGEDDKNYTVYGSNILLISSSIKALLKNDLLEKTREIENNVKILYNRLPKKDNAILSSDFAFSSATNEIYERFISDPNTSSISRYALDNLFFLGNITNIIKI